VSEQTMTFSDLRQRYRRAQDGFDAIVAAVPTNRWDDASRCTEWTNRDVLGHVVWGQELVRHLATGQRYESRVGAPGAPHPAELVPGDPVTTWRAARAASTPTLTDDALAREVELVFGRIPLAGFVTALVTDFLAHTWDIGAAVGLPVQLDPQLVPDALAWARQHNVRRPGGIGPEVPVPPDADPRTRFLAFLGREATAAGR
jgi:uncharacterized protein (TIGR03086 family)